MTVGIPRRADNGVDLPLQRLERGIDEAAAIALFEFGAIKLDRGHSRADVRLRHSRSSPKAVQSGATPRRKRWFRNSTGRPVGNVSPSRGLVHGPYRENSNGQQ